MAQGMQNTKMKTKVSTSVIGPTQHIYGRTCATAKTHMCYGKDIHVLHNDTYYTRTHTWTHLYMETCRYTLTDMYVLGHTCTFTLTCVYVGHTHVYSCTWGEGGICHMVVMVMWS